MRAVRAAGLLFGAGLIGVLLGLSAGAEGWSWGWSQWSAESELILQLRLPRTLSAWLAGAALGLAGAIAQGLFRNPLADPYLLGSAAGAHLAVSLWLSGTSAWAAAGLLPFADLASHGLNLPLAAFLGALAGVLCSLVLAGGLREGPVLLLCGVVVGMLMAAAAEALALIAPEVLRSRQAFLLGTTAFTGPQSVVVLAAALVVGLLMALPCARALDALTLGESAASTLGLPLRWCRAGLIIAMALVTGAAVAQVGLVGFVGLAAAHVVRTLGAPNHRALLWQAAACGGAMLAIADALCRGLAAPMEWPIGLVTALLGGGYLLFLLRRGSSRSL